MIRAALGALLLFLGMYEPAQAQSWIQFTTCGTPPRPLTPGAAATIGVDLTGNLCISGSISASLSGFAPASTGTPITADTNAETGSLPAGAVVVASNTSTTIPAYCKLGASATVADQLIAPSSWFAFTVGANTQLTCITASSTAVVNMVGGTGLPTGAGGGGGSGGGGGGAVTIADGADVAQGTTTDAACATDNGTCTELALIKRTNQRLTTVNTTLGTPLQAGGNIGTVTAVTGITNPVATTHASGSVASGAYASGSIATGAYASGSIGSGAIASGAVASGAFASGSIASGAIAAGAQVDLLTMRGTKAPGTAAANSMLQGCVYTAAGVTLADGQQAARQCSSTGGALVSVVNTNANGQATMANSSPVVIASNQSANALWGQGATGAAVPANAQYMGFNSGGNLTAPSITAPLPVNNTGPYPIGATPYTATATGTTGATTATLAGASSVTTYICGFSIRANATAAVTNNATVTGVITATLNFTQWTAPNASGLGITEMIFSPCIPASGTNQSVAVVSGAPGTGGVVSVTAWGYKL